MKRKFCEFFGLIFLKIGKSKLDGEENWDFDCDYRNRVIKFMFSFSTVHTCFIAFAICKVSPFILKIKIDLTINKNKLANFVRNKMKSCNYSHRCHCQLRCLELRQLQTSYNLFSRIVLLSFNKRQLIENCQIAKTKKITRLL